MMATGTRSLIAVAAVGVLAALLAPGVATGQAAVSILGMAWTTTPAPALVISASGPLTFTKTQSEPGVVLLEFPEAILANPLPAVEEPTAGLRHAALSTVDEGGRQWARLRVDADPDSIITVAGLPSGVEVRVEKPNQQPRAAQAMELEDVIAVADSTGVTVQLNGRGPLEVKAFTLEDPPRVVADLKGVVNRVSRRTQPVGAGGVKQVRVAQFATSPDPVVRVVVDLEQPMSYRADTTAQGAVLRVGGEPAAAPEAAAAATPAEKPAEVAQAAPAPAAGQEIAPAAGKVEPTAEKPAETAPAPVQIVTEPGPQKQEPVVPAVPPPPETPRQAPPAESPWTTTQAAMAEQAGNQVNVVTTGTKEVESQVAHFTGEPISLELKDADIKDVLRTFAKITGLNVVVDPDVSGSVTVNLENVPWDQSLDIILKVNQLGYTVENNVLRVAKMQRLTAEKAQAAAFRKESENAAPLRTITKTLSYAKAADVKTLLTSQGFILSDRGTVVVDERSNMLIIRDANDRLEGIVNLIDSVDQPNKQVVIEARIVESTRSFARALGIVWGFTGNADAAHGTSTGWAFPNWATVTGKSDFGGAAAATNISGLGILSFAFGDILDSFNLDFTINAAENDGLARIVSSPKVTAQNNEKAHIQSGTLLPIQTVANQTVTVQYVDATLSLDVTPQITAEGTVLLDVDIKKREPVAGVNIAGGQNVPISTRDAKTRVMVRDGGTTVIGGIFRTTENDQKNGVPGLNKLPLIGWMFGNKSISNERDELLIFITPRIVKY